MQVNSGLRSLVVSGDHVGVAAVLCEGADPDMLIPWQFPEAFGGKLYIVPVIMVASCQGHIKIVSTLLGVNANVEARGDFHYTALHTAAVMGNYEVADILLTNGADINSKDSQFGK